MLMVSGVDRDLELANKQILVMALNPGFVTPKNLNYFD
jgi:hypothetical protein